MMRAIEDKSGESAGMLILAGPRQLRPHFVLNLPFIFFTPNSLLHRNFHSLERSQAEVLGAGCANELCSQLLEA